MPQPTRKVTGTWTNPATQQPASGRLVFRTLPPVWVDVDGGEILTGAGTATLTAGTLDRDLVLTSAPGVEPATGRYWQVEVRIDGLPYWERTFELTAGAAVPLSQLVAADPAQAGYTPVEGPPGPAGPAGATGAPGPQGPQPPLGAAGAGPTIALKSDDPTTTNSRTPTGPAGGALTGTYPNPTLSSATANSFYPAASGQALDGYVSDALTRLSAVEQGAAFLAGLNTTGLARVINTELRVEGSGGTLRHRLDGAGNAIGLYGATPVGQQTVSGSRADGTALASLLTALAATGLIVNSSTVGQPPPEDLPGEQNLLSWTYDPAQAGHVTAQSSAGVAGRITLVRIPIRTTITWSNIWLGLAGVDAGASLSNCYLGVYDTSGALKGVTADISSSLMSGATAKALPLTSSFSATPGFYFIAMLLGNGSTWTTNSLTFKASGAGISVNAGLTAPNLRYSNLLSGQTSLPSSLTLSSQSTSIITTGWGSQWYGVS